MERWCLNNRQNNSKNNNITSIKLHYQTKSKCIKNTTKDLSRLSSYKHAILRVIQKSWSISKSILNAPGNDISYLGLHGCRTSYIKCSKQKMFWIAGSLCVLYPVQSNTKNCHWTQLSTCLPTFFTWGLKQFSSGYDAFCSQYQCWIMFRNQATQTATPYLLKSKMRLFP